MFSLHKAPCQSDSSTHLVHAASEVRLKEHFAFSTLYPLPILRQAHGMRSPAEPLNHPSLFCSLLSWVCPRMPEVNEAISNGKPSRQLGRIWVADKII